MVSEKRKRRFFEKVDAIFTPPMRRSIEHPNPVHISPHKEVPKEHMKEDSNKIYVVPLGRDISRKRIDIWRNQLNKLKAIVVDVYSTSVTTVVASTSLSQEKLRENYPDMNMANVVTPEWLIQFIKCKKSPDHSQFQWYSEDDIKKQILEEEVPPKESPNASPLPPIVYESTPNSQASTQPPAAFPIPELSQEEAMEARKELFYQNNPGMRAIHADDSIRHHKIKKDGFVCMTSSVLKANLNKHLTDPLEELISYLNVERDEWRENSYKRIVSILKQMPEKVTDVSKLKTQHGFNNNGIAKLREILETGTLRKLEAKKADSRLQVLQRFSNIWGVGPSTATDLYSAGFRTLEDLQAKELEVLNKKQRIGLKHYEDFLVKIPRQEVEEIESLVKSHILKLLPRAVAITCGSYRRGKIQSGDVDILISDPFADDCSILPHLLTELHDIGFLTDDLTTTYEHHIGGSDSYMGVCRLREGMRFRRIDIKVYPRNCFGYAQLYFTGSDHFNRSMRAFAKMKGYSLTDKSLFKVTRDKGVKKLRNGPNLICPDEKDVFIALQLPYKRPEERNCMA